MRRALDAVRIREWKASKLNPLFAGLGLALVTTSQYSFAVGISVVELMWVIVVNAAFGYAINNYADRTVDALAHKPNVFSTMRPRWSALIVIALLLLGVGSATLFFWNQPAVVAVCALSFGLATAYSMPPLRLKERGWLGIVSSSLAQRVIPLVAGCELFHAWNVATITYLGLAFVVGLRFMVVHQIDDEENDRLAHVTTLLARFQRGALEKFLTRVVGPLELGLIGLVIGATAMTNLLAGTVLALVWGLSVVFDAARLGIRPWYLASSLTYWGYDRFYVIGLPVVVTSVIVVASPRAWPLAVVCAILVAPEVARVVDRLVARARNRTRERHDAARERRWTSRESETFAFPVGVLLFNRPDYARQMLESLKTQSARVDHARLTIHVDGYVNSRDQARGLPDQTTLVAQLAREAFPTARILVSEFNVGIAAAYELVEEHVFADEDAHWGVFLEEDFVLYPTYLQTLTHMIDECSERVDVAMVSATGDTAQGLSAQPESSPAMDEPSDDLAAMGHSWAYALRREHAIERRPFLSAYLHAVRQGPYWMRDNQAIWRACALAGFFPMGSSQDYVKRAVMLKLGRVALTTARAHGFYVGQEGEHFTPDAFRQHGYDAIPERPRSARFNRDNLDACVARARHDIERMMALIGVTDIVDPLGEALRIPFTPRRWDAKDAPVTLEGPFPELGLHRPFVWLVGCETNLNLTVNADGVYEVQFTVTNYHKGQVVTITSGQDTSRIPVPLCTQTEPAVLRHSAKLVAGSNDITIAYSKSRRGVGDDRELGITLIDITV